MGLFSGFMNYIDEDTIRMKSSEGALECKLLLEDASDSDFLGYTQAFTRMCNKGKEPRELHFIMALCDEAKKRPIQVERQVVDTLKTIYKTDKYNTLISNLERNVERKENSVPKQKKCSSGNEKIEKKHISKKKLSVIAKEMSTQKLKRELNNANNDIEKEVYLIELKERDEYREKAVKLSVNDLKKQCNDIQKGNEKIVYREEISRRYKVFSKLQKDYTDVTERIAKLTDLYKCDAILKEDYEEKIKKWGGELEKTKAIEHQKLFADLEKNTPDVVGRIKKLEELYEKKVISQKDYESKRKEWGEELEKAKEVEHQRLFADLEKNTPDVVERIKKLKELYDNTVITQKEYEEKKYDWLS